jgi:hypothetical protein
MLGRWSHGQGPELEAFLCGHAGDPIRVDRLSRASETVDSPALTLCVAAQPAALQRLGRRDLVERGLHARFMWIYPEDQRGQGTFDGALPISPAHRAAFESGLRAMLQLQATDIALSMTDSARALFGDFYDAVEKRLGPGGDLRNLQGWGEKYCGMVGRLAGLLHLAESGTTSQIDAKTMRRALAIGEWALAHSLIAFEVMDIGKPARAVARVLLGVVHKLGRTRISARDLFREVEGRKGFETRETINAGLQYLVDTGWLKPVKSPLGTPGRPSEQYDVNPATFDSVGFVGSVSRSMNTKSGVLIGLAELASTGARGGGSP